MFGRISSFFLYLINKHNGSSVYLSLNGGITLPSILQQKMTPFMALYGYHPPSITSSLRENSKGPVVEDHIKHQQEVLQLLKDNLNLAHKWKKQQAYQHHSERSFDVGDWIFLWLKLYKQISLK